MTGGDIMKSFENIINNFNVDFIDYFGKSLRFYWYHNGKTFLVVASKKEDEDHVSISHTDRSIKPSMEDILALRQLCFYNSEKVEAYMKGDGFKGLVENCYHIYHKKDKVKPLPIFAFNLRKKTKD